MREKNVLRENVCVYNIQFTLSVPALSSLPSFVVIMAYTMSSSVYFDETL